MDVHHFVADWQYLRRALHEQGSRADPKIVAPSFKQMASAIGGDIRLHAVVEADDDEGRKAFDDARFRVWPANGNRPKEVERLKREIEDDVLERKAGLLTLVTMDPELEGLARLADRGHWVVRVWGAAQGTPSVLQSYNFQPLEDLLPELRPKRVVVLVDLENIYISLQKEGKLVNPQKLAEVLQTRARRHGQVENVYCYADWSTLSSEGQDLQRLFEMAGIATRYELSLKGKNSSDMAIIDKAHKLLQGSDGPDILILVTGDRDFRAIIETAKQRYHKKVVLWGKKGNTSPWITQAADEVEWIDDFLAFPEHRELDAINRTQQKRGDGLIDPLVELAVRIDGLLWSKKLPWVSPGRLLDVLVPSADPEAKIRTRELITQARTAGLLHCEQVANPHTESTKPMVDALTLNAEHPGVKAGRLVRRQAEGRIIYSLETQHMPYVGFSYMATGLGMDSELERAGLARTREEQIRWLNLLVEAGFLVKEHRTSPQNCTALRIAQPVLGPEADDDAETMVRRLVTRADTFMRRRNLSWVAVGWLHGQIGRFGNAVFQTTVDGLTQAGEAEKQYHDNPNAPRATLGLHLNPTGAMISSVRQERDQVLAALSQMPDPQALTPEAVKARVEQVAGPAGVDRWLKILADEEIVLPEGNSYCLNRQHPLLGTTPVVLPTEDDQIETSRLCKLLAEGLTDAELTRLAFEEFRPVYNEYAAGMAKGRKEQMLVEYAQRQHLVPKLTSAVTTINPRRAAQILPQAAAA